MRIQTEVQYAALSNLYLDVRSPRLGHWGNPDLSQEEVLDIMRDWALPELAASYLDSGGFWTHEALLVTEEELGGEHRLVVIDGNRRLAALIYLDRAFKGEAVSKKWSLLVENREVPQDLFTKIPYIRVDSRQAIEGFLGFHHRPTGTKSWDLMERGQYIAKLIDERNLSYEKVAGLIGNMASTVRHHYIFQRILLQMEENIEDFSLPQTNGHFYTMYHALRKPSVQKYLGIDMFADEHAAQHPVPKARLEALSNFALWLFGSKDANKDPLFTASSNLDDFDRILENAEAVEYLENSEHPRLDFASIVAFDETEITQLFIEARHYIAISLTRIHHYKDSSEVQDAVEQLATDIRELLNQFPSSRAELLNKD